jgi:hypothetical protein
MAVTLQNASGGIGTLAYPFYVADFIADTFPIPTADNATLFVVETRRTYIWREYNWVLYAENPQLAAALTSSAQDADRRIQVANLRELRAIRMLLAAQQGILVIDPIPEIDN